MAASLKSKSKFSAKTAYPAKPPIDVYQKVTDQIIALLDQGVRPWSKPWSGGSDLLRPLRFNGVPYQGINVLILWMTAQEKGYSSPFWMSFRQAVELGGNVRKGERSTIIAKPKPYQYVINEGTPDEEVRTGNSFTAFPVFNADQIDGLPEKYLRKAPVAVPAAVANERIASADAFFDALGLKLSHGGPRAFYSPTVDRIQMPEFASFVSAEAYYATLGHETVHWTRHETRLNRSFGRERWGDEGYAAEELVAELGAAYLCADLGLTNTPREDHASYIAHWLKVLKNDKKAIFVAASAAEKAVKFLHQVVHPVPVSTTDEAVDGEVETRMAA